MRYYGFGNYYLSSIQQGIQAAHCIADILVKYPTDVHQSISSRNWAINHKTIILLNGGNKQSLFELSTFLDSPHNPYPWGSFHEDQQSLNECLTHVGIILPESVYSAAELIRKRIVMLTQHDDNYKLFYKEYPQPAYEDEFSNWELQLILKLNGCGLAN